MTLTTGRSCGYCGTSLAYEGGTGAYKQIFCNDACVDAYEREVHRDGADMEYEAALELADDAYGIY